MITLEPNKAHMIIKRDGSEEAYSPRKLLDVLLWACDGNEVLANSVLEAVDLRLYNRMHISILFDEVIDTVRNLVSRLTPAYDEVAKKLYLQKMYKELYAMNRDTYPDYLDVLEVLIENNVMIDVLELFTYEELVALGDYLEPSRDLLTSDLGLVTYFKKNSKKVNGKPVELMQHGHMRLAIQAFLYEPKDIRMGLIKKRYDDLSTFKYTEASPKWMNSLKYEPQMASCCLHQMGDNTENINKVNNDIGQYSRYNGGNAVDVSDIRCYESSIGTEGKSSGLLPNLKLTEAYISLYNQLGDRPGACIVTAPWWHADISEFLLAKDEGGKDSERARKLQYSIKINRIFLERIKNDQKISLFDPKDARKLNKVYGEEFDKEYLRLEALGVAIKTVDAQEIAYEIAKIMAETGNLYVFFSENANEQSPFNDIITQSNLCVVGDTKILTKEGYKPIQELAGTTQECWNGEQWSKTPIFKTGESQKVVEVKLSNGSLIKATPYHKWYLDDGTEVRTQELREGDKLIKFDLEPTTKNFTLDKDMLSTKDSDYIQKITLFLQELGIHSSVEKEGSEYKLLINEPNGDITVESVVDHEELADTYCGTEPLRHKLMFNGVLTGNCHEVFLPTKEAKFLGSKVSYDLTSGENIETDEWESGWLALCNLSSINVFEWDKLNPDERMEVARNLLRASDNLIDYQYYPVKDGEVFNRNFRAIGIGMNNLAQLFASKGVKFSDEEAKVIMRDVSASMKQTFTDASEELALERGNFNFYHKCNLTRPSRFATLFSIAPTASSSLIANATEGIEPILKLVTEKTGTYSHKQLAPNMSKYGSSYELAFDIDTKVLYDLAAIRQEVLLDQGQSINTYMNDVTSAYKIIDNIIYAESKGLKSLYYLQSKNTEVEVCDSCSS